ncbi:hypothetical protein Nepgr_014979 [Nepenthes gracilis]|uniref:F-box/LRR-repeat protein 15-like leucin rich repeat domain-containing protein n=1 Tax=Nepenthes gracilis TaxID=150966 RepID=A0AAD3XQC7_NEPGR|nr:hypothetical protein Nepgr_014979 [Nepenthes gracilis]
MKRCRILSLLTEDLLIRIRTKLTDDVDKKSFRLVCKSFYRVDSLSRTRLRVLRPEFLLDLLAKFPRVEIVDLSVCPRVDDWMAALMLTVGNSDSMCLTPRVRSLVLRRASGLRHVGLEMLVRACSSRLEMVDMSYCCGFGDREAQALSCAMGLRDLRLDKCLNVTDVGLAHIAVGCGSLERLSLKWCSEITDLGIDLLTKKCLGLKYLDISYLEVTSESLRSIASLQMLESLAMVGSPSVDDAGLHFLGDGCPLLKAIDISRCKGISSTGLCSVIKGHRSLVHLNASHCMVELSSTLLHWLKDLKCLNSLIFDGACVTENTIQTIPTGCKSLVEIGLGKCSWLTDADIKLLVTGCNNLKILNLTCDSITDASISTIVENCRNLVCLKLESCNLITEKSLEMLGSYCMLLEELDLTECCGVIDRALNHLSRCSELQCLKLGLCTNISDKGLSYIASNCTKISELDLYRCPGIGDDGLSALSSSCKKLKKLNVSYCNRLTDRGMEHIGKLEELSDLEMRGLKGITGAGLMAVVAGCERLTQLDLKHCENIKDSGFWAVACYSKDLRQINLSYCAISDLALCLVMSNLTCLQDAKLVHLINVSVGGFELALRACCGRLKKVNVK